MANASFLTAIVGGALIGSSATLLLLTLGRVAGVSGIIGNLVALRRAAESWQLGFVIGLLVVGGFLFAPTHSNAEVFTPYASVAAGLLVGLGTRLGNGCTSGHGVCGLSRLSRRSMVATSTFIVTAMVVVAFVRHVFGVGAS